MDQWAINNLAVFREIYLKYNESELALSSCAMTMMKILNGLSEMSYTNFHRYERKMLWEAMKLFSSQCLEQIEIALECQNVEKKREYIMDIESSIAEMVDVYKNVMGEVSNVERQIFQSLSVDTKIHALSPKLCAFYSSILERVVAMFYEDNIEYAFVLHPTLHSTIEAKVLLEKREESGKVVIIYVSENVIENFDLVSICLLHEVFHILTKNERMRKKRAEIFTIQVMEQMQRLILQGVFFGEKEKEIKEKLRLYYFKDISKLLEEFKNREEDNKSFYGQSIQEEVKNKMKEYLGKEDGDLEDIIMNVFCQNKKFENYSEYEQQTLIVAENVKKIRKNIFYIVSENLIAKVADQIMFIYREAYADIACILLLEIEPKLYKEAFLRSIQFQYDSSYIDTARNLRETLVARIVTRTISPKFQESWKYYAEEMEEENWNQRDVMEEKKYLQKEHFYGRIEINSTIMGWFEKYLEKCGNKFSERLKNLTNLEGFRSYMKNIITGSSQQALKDVLEGKNI